MLCKHFVHRVCLSDSSVWITCESTPAEISVGLEALIIGILDLQIIHISGLRRNMHRIQEFFFFF